MIGATELEWALARREITRLRAELERVREAGRAVVEWSEMSDLLRFNRGFIALKAALEGEEGK